MVQKFLHFEYTHEYEITDMGFDEKYLIILHRKMLFI